MNHLKSLINQSIEQQNLTRALLAVKLGYRNISKGLRALDDFIESLKDSNDIRVKLQDVLAIPEEHFDAAILERFNEIYASEIREFKPHITVKWNRLPNLLITGGAYKKLLHIEVPESLSNLSLDDELAQVCKIYQQHQLKHFAADFGLQGEDHNYAAFIRCVDEAIDANSLVNWAVGDGFQYFRTFGESVRFDRNCRHSA